MSFKMTCHVRTLGLLGVIGLICTSGAQAQLIAYYKADGNALDSAGNHNGTAINGVGYGPGVFGQAFQLNGTNQYISVPDDPAWAFGSNPFTLSVWANFNSIRSGPLGQLPDVFIGQDEGSGPTNKWVFYYDGNGDLAFHVNGTSGSTFLTAPTTISPTTDAWHLYTLTDTGTAFTFYEDGKSLGTVSESLTIPDVNANLTLGEAEGLGYIDGSLDDIRIYNTALSPDQVAALASAATPEPGSVSLLVAGAVVGLGILRRRRATRVQATTITRKNCQPSHLR